MCKKNSGSLANWLSFISLGLISYLVFTSTCFLFLLLLFQQKLKFSLLPIWVYFLLWPVSFLFCQCPSIPCCPQASHGIWGPCQPWHKHHGTSFGCRRWWHRAPLPKGHHQRGGHQRSMLFPVPFTIVAVTMMTPTIDSRMDYPLSSINGLSQEATSNLWKGFCVEELMTYRAWSVKCPN